MDTHGRRIDAAYLNALRLGPQRIALPANGTCGIPLPVASRLAATGKVAITDRMEARYVGE